MASGLASAIACTTGPGVDLAQRRREFDENSMPEPCSAIICCLNAAVADLPYS